MRSGKAQKSLSALVPQYDISRPLRFKAY